jgi:hypothetical protein
MNVRHRTPAHLLPHMADSWPPGQPIQMPDSIVARTIVPYRWVNEHLVDVFLSAKFYQMLV